MPTPPTDEQLVVQMRDGSDAAFRTLVERHHDDLLRFLARLVNDRAAAEDLFQETFLQVYLSADTFDETRRFRPWLFTIAANKGRDHLRRKGRRRTVDLSAPIRGAGGDRGPSFVDLMEVDVPPPGAGIEENERDAQVQDALNTLAPSLREILLLAYFQRLSYARIAEDLGIPLGTVKSRLHAAVAAFAREWQRRTRNQEP